MPKHVAIIMDGNGRWAKRRFHPRVFGHIRGSSRIKAIVREANELGVKALTLYAFSSENWVRPEAERSVLWKLLIKYLAKETDELARENVCLRVIGELDRLPDPVLAVLRPALAKLAGNTGLQLSFALSYGSRNEILAAANGLLAAERAGKIGGEITEELFEKYLWTAPLKELSSVDLVIRTSGEKRTSNFLLWQSAYAEYWFTDACWPEFTPALFREAIADFQKRDRRFGGIGGIPSGTAK